MTRTPRASMLGGEPTSVIGMLQRSAQANPDAVAIIDAEDQLTYGRLWTSVLALAEGLRRAGVQEGDRVAVWMPNIAFWLQTHMALSGLGAIAVPVNARYPVPEATAVLKAADARTLVVAPGSGGVADSASVDTLLHALDGRVQRVVAYGETLDLYADVRQLNAEVLFQTEGRSTFLALDAAPNIAFSSSGSTGKPKLILHGQANIVEHSAAVATAYAYREPGVVVLGQLPLCGVWGFNTAYAAITAGRPVVLVPRYDATHAVRLIDEHEVTHANGPDMFVRSLFKAAADTASPLKSMREIGFATFSNDSRDLVAMGDGLGITMFQLYGSSEQQALMVRQPANAGPTRRADPGGTPVSPSIQLRVRDVENGQTLGPEQTGELETRGPHVMLGYLTADGIDRSTFTDDGWVRSGDLAMLTEWGFRFVGRAQDALRLSGFLVDPREIENYLESLEGIEQAQVVGIDTERGPKAVAFAVPTRHHSADEGEWLAACKRELASFKVPIRIATIEDFPRVDGANGPRIQRKALRAMADELYLSKPTAE